MENKNYKSVNNLPIPIEFIARRIYLIRGQKTMLDADLAELYQVPTKRLNEAVKRNLARFPKDFMFQLAEKEASILRSQFATLEKGRGRYSKYTPLAFTEHGVAMLSAVLKSRRAVTMSILIVRAFIQMRGFLASQKDVAEKIRVIEKQQKHQGIKIDIIYKIVEDLLRKPKPEKKVIGFRTN